MIKKLSTLLQSVGLNKLAQQVATDNESELFQIDVYVESLYQRLVQAEDLHKALYSLTLGILLILRNPEEILPKQNIVKQTPKPKQLNLSIDSSIESRRFNRSASQQAGDQKSSTQRSYRTINRSQSNLYTKSLKSQERKIMSTRIQEMQELSKCTFRPQVNKNQQLRDKINTPVFDRLSQQAINQKLKHKDNLEKKERNQMKGCTFKPITNAIKKENQQTSSFQQLSQDVAIGSVLTDNSLIAPKTQRCSQLVERMSENRTNEFNENLMEKINRINFQMDSVMKRQKLPSFRESAKKQKLTTHTATFTTN